MKKLILFCAIFMASTLFCQNTASDRMIAEIQQVKQNDKNMKLVWWIPTEYWRVATESSTSVQQEQMEVIENLLDDYTIIAAGDYNLGSKDNAVDFNYAPIGKNLQLYDLNGNKILALKDSQINKTVAVLVNDVLKPLFAKMLGKMGSGIEIFVFNNKDISGNKVLDAMKKGGFKVAVNGDSFNYTLPLISLMEEKNCPVDQQKLPGNYIYCPIHGTKL